MVVLLVYRFHRMDHPCILVRMFHPVLIEPFSTARAFLSLPILRPFPVADTLPLIAPWTYIDILRFTHLRISLGLLGIHIMVLSCIWLAMVM